MKKETKERIYNLIHDFDNEDRIAMGLVAFLETEENGQKMIHWLETSDKSNWTENSILKEMDNIRGFKMPDNILKELGEI